jgi:hypothetical protein
MVRWPVALTEGCLEVGVPQLFVIFGIVGTKALGIRPIGVEFS